MKAAASSPASRAFDIINVSLMMLLLASIIGPFLYVLLVSLTNQTNISFMFGPGGGISFNAYTDLFANGERLLLAFAVSVGRTAIGSFVNLLFTVLIAYPLSRRYLPGKNYMVFYLVITMLFNGGVIPSYLLVAKLQLIDRFLVYFLPGLVSVWLVFIMRNFFMSIPVALEEAAKIDGAGDTFILFRIVLPLSMPALATLGMFYAIVHWNTWVDAVMYIRSAEKYPLHLYLQQLIMENKNMSEMVKRDTATRPSTPEAIKNAVLLLSTLPIMLVYPFVQKYFIKGIMIGAIKG